MTMKKTVLFICTQNSARSQMAEGLMRYYLGKYYDAFSAGTEPFRVNPLAVSVMKEIGIDISSQVSKGIDVFKEKTFDYVVTVCDNVHEACPWFPNARARFHKSFEDPASGSCSYDEFLDKFRTIRDRIKEWLLDTFSKSQSSREDM